MKQILIISYYFPPLGMGGVQRSLKFAKYLPEFGWQPTVLTVKDVAYYAKDFSLLEELPPSVHCTRTESLDPIRLIWKIRSLKHKTNESPGNSSLSRLHWLSRMLSWIMIPDTKIGWLPFAKTQALKLHHQKNFDMILSTSPPHSSHLLALSLARRTGVPWIADFRDHWNQEKHENQSSLHRRIDLFLLRKVLKNTSHTVSVSEPITMDLLRLSGRSDADLTTITNGFDRSDFPDLISTKHDKMIILYNGSINRVLHPECFLKALSLAMKQCPEMKEKAEMHFVGGVQEVDLEILVQTLNLQGTVKILGYKNHRHSLQHLNRADLLLLILNKNSSEGVVTGKIYEYLASGKPIFACIPHGEAQKLIVKFARGIVVPHDVQAMKTSLIRCFELWKRGDLTVTVPRWRGLEYYDRKFQTRRLADLMDQIID